jgi:SAM-dependent methyltransferase
MPETPYGQYILTTGEGIVGQIEMVWGRFLYESRFQGKQPIADVGPGRCWFTRQNPDDIVAIDNAPDLVEHYTAQQLRISLGSAYEIPFPDAYFEGVFCCWLLEHLPEPARAILEFHRVLKPGGCVRSWCPRRRIWPRFMRTTRISARLPPLRCASWRPRAASRAAAWRTFPWTRGMRLVYRRFGERAATGTCFSPTAICGVWALGMRTIWCWTRGNEFTLFST